MIQARSLTKRFGPRTVLDGLDLEARPGEVLLLVGANGCGKSTLLRCLLGLMPYEGTLQVCGHDPLLEGEEVRRRTGYMPQRDGLHDDMTVADAMAFYGAVRGAPPAELRDLLARVRLEAATAARIGEISGGMRQRLAFALALIGDPPLLLLDEPTASLDRRSRDALVQSVLALAAGGKCVIFATHDPHPALLAASRAVQLREGRIVAPSSAPVARRVPALAGGAE